MGSCLCRPPATPGSWPPRSRAHAPTRGRPPAIASSCVGRPLLSFHLVCHLVLLPPASAVRQLAFTFASSRFGPRPPPCVRQLSRWASAPLPPRPASPAAAGAGPRLLMAAPLDAACLAFALGTPRASADSLSPPCGDMRSDPPDGGPFALSCTAISLGNSASSVCCSASPSGRCYFESPPFVATSIVPPSAPRAASGRPAFGRPAVG